MVVTDHLETNEIRRLNWPARSPDSNIIKHLRSTFSRAIFRGGKQYQKISNLKKNFQLNRTLSESVDVFTSRCRDGIPLVNVDEIVEIIDMKLGPSTRSACLPNSKSPNIKPSPLNRDSAKIESAISRSHGPHRPKRWLHRHPFSLGSGVVRDFTLHYTELCLTILPYASIPRWGGGALKFLPRSAALFNRISCY